ncbi:uncharacterized protein LOC130291996 [Hyla sarda]|uniref:uncharacterized protein LOC130291996 n=1 Tax=Hyla sarda TaxID=327740 RepID=UPI0024C20FA6|nr:uncharacterized protein LOC130291996 [Hyla sarda]
MERLCAHPKAAVLLAVAWMLIGLQNTGAQTTRVYRNTTGPVPGWGIALLVMLSLLAALMLLGIIFLPLWCQNTENDCQDGISFYSPNILCKPRGPCDEQCQQRSCISPNIVFNTSDPCNRQCEPMPRTSPIIMCKPREPRTAESCTSPSILFKPREPRTVECEDRSFTSPSNLSKPRELRVECEEILVEPSLVPERTSQALPPPWHQDFTRLHNGCCPSW